MGYLETWNDIVEWSERKGGALENEIQSEWEEYFADSEYFGYSKKKNEVDNKRSIKLGSVNKLIPDIVIRKDNKDLFVVELKPLYKLPEEGFRKQLFCYLKQLELNIGILVCKNICVYSYKGNDDYSCIKIPFEKNSQDGVKFVELFSRCNFDKEKIEDFIASKINKDKKIKEMQELINNEYLIDLIKKDLSSGCTENEIEEVLNDFSISVTEKIKRETFPQMIDGYNGMIKSQKEQKHKNYAEGYFFKGGSRNKLMAQRLLYALREENKITDEMLSAFQDRNASKHLFHFNYKLLTDDPGEIQDDWGRCRYYPNNPIVINGTKYWICSQWSHPTKIYRDNFAKTQGIDLEDTKYDNYF